MPSHKRLKSVAHSIAHHFASTLCYCKTDYAIHHLAEASKHLNAPIVEIELLTQMAKPTEIKYGMVAELIPYLNNFLIKLLVKEGFPVDAISAATLQYNFAVGRINLYNLPSYDCVSSITTPDGRKYEAHLTEANN